VQGERQPPRSTTRSLVEITNQSRHITMGYINDFRAKLTALIEDGRTEEAVKFAADKVLESYHNGAGLIEKADPADVRKAERFVKRAQKNVPRR
jgi:hypothetical protein